jgi:hypothetical protein
MPCFLFGVQGVWTTDERLNDHQTHSLPVGLMFIFSQSPLLKDSNSTVKVLWF